MTEIPQKKMQFDVVSVRKIAHEYDCPGYNIDGYSREAFRC